LELQRIVFVMLFISVFYLFRFFREGLAKQGQPYFPERMKEVVLPVFKE